MEMFRKLGAKEEKEFRQWARDNYKPFSEIKGVWHPVIQDECVKINKKAGKNVTGFINPKKGKNRGDKMSSKLNKYKVLYALPRDSKQHQITVKADGFIAAKHEAVKRIKGAMGIVYGITLIEENGEKVEYPKRRGH